MWYATRVMTWAAMRIRPCTGLGSGTAPAFSASMAWRTSSACIWRTTAHLDRLPVNDLSLGFNHKTQADLVPPRFAGHPANGKSTSVPKRIEQAGAPAQL